MLVLLIQKKKKKNKNKKTHTEKQTNTHNQPKALYWICTMTLVMLGEQNKSWPISLSEETASMGQLYIVLLVTSHLHLPLFDKVCISFPKISSPRRRIFSCASHVECGLESASFSNLWVTSHKSPCFLYTVPYTYPAFRFLSHVCFSVLFSIGSCTDERICESSTALHHIVIVCSPSCSSGRERLMS